MRDRIKTKRVMKERAKGKSTGKYKTYSKNKKRGREE